jgi:hypothetical protein
MLAGPDVLHLLADELTGLRRGAFALAPIPARRL